LPTELKKIINILTDKKYNAPHYSHFDIQICEQVLHYSFITSVKYENSSVNVTENLVGDNFEKGLYTVNIFDKNELVSTSNFSLK
jgi:hypothetical protein